MKEYKNTWFISYGYRLWIPITWEGWLLLLSLASSLFLIYIVNGVSREVRFSFSTHWPMLLELAVVIIAFYWISNGRVEKR